MLHVMKMSDEIPKEVIAYNYHYVINHEFPNDKTVAKYKCSSEDNCDGHLWRIKGGKWISLGHHHHPAGDWLDKVKVLDLSLRQESNVDNDNETDEEEERNVDEANVEVASVHSLADTTIVISSDEEAEERVVRRCCICLDREPVAVFMPCRHLCLCDDCYMESEWRHERFVGSDGYQRRCDICRSEVTEVISIIHV